MTVADLLRGLLIYSANDAAATLAARVGGSEAAFVRTMNARARQLGLKDTHYANPIGLDDPAQLLDRARSRAAHAAAARVRLLPPHRRRASRSRCTPATTRARS